MYIYAMLRVGDVLVTAGYSGKIEFWSATAFKMIHRAKNIGVSTNFLRHFATKASFKSVEPRANLNLIKAAKEIPKPPERDISGWRTTQASKEFPETALRAILQEYEVRLRDNLFKFQKEKYKDMIINDFLKAHYGFTVKAIHKESKMCQVVTRKMTVGQAPWWFWVMVLNSNNRKNKLRWSAWKKIRQKLGVSKPTDNAWMIRHRVKKRLPVVPAVYDDLGHKCTPRIQLSYKVLPPGDIGQAIYGPIQYRSKSSRKY